MAAGTQLDRWADLPISESLQDPSFAHYAANYLVTNMRTTPLTIDNQSVPIRPAILESGLLHSMNDAAGYLIDLIRRTCWSLTDDPIELARLVGLRHSDVPLVDANDPFDEIAYSICNVRPDVVIRDGVPVFFECNFGAANADGVMVHRLSNAYANLYGSLASSRGGEFSEPYEGRLALYQRLFAEKNLPQAVAILGSMREADVFDPAFFETEAQYLRDRGVEARYMEPDEIEGHANKDKRYGVALKVGQSDGWQALGFDLKGLRRAHRETAFLVSDSGQSLSSKLIFAWLSSGTHLAADADRDFVAKHIPWTRILAPGSVEFDGQDWDLEELAIRKQVAFVIKPFNLCAGRGVILGRDLNATEWARYIKTFASRQDCVIQEYVTPDPLQMEFYDFHSREIRRVDGSYVLGPYLVDGVPSGCYLRHAALDKPQIVNFGTGSARNIAFGNPSYP